MASQIPSGPLAALRNSSFKTSNLPKSWTPSGKVLAPTSSSTAAAAHAQEEDEEWYWDKWARWTCSRMCMHMFLVIMTFTWLVGMFFWYCFSHAFSSKKALLRLEWQMDRFLTIDQAHALATQLVIAKGARTIHQKCIQFESKQLHKREMDCLLARITEDDSLCEDEWDPTLEKGWDEHCGAATWEKIAKLITDYRQQYNNMLDFFHSTHGMLFAFVCVLMHSHFHMSDPFWLAAFYVAMRIFRVPASYLLWTGGQQQLAALACTFICIGFVRSAQKSGLASDLLPKVMQCILWDMRAEYILVWWCLREHFSGSLVEHCSPSPASVHCVVYIGRLFIFCFPYKHFHRFRMIVRWHMKFMVRAVLDAAAFVLFDYFIVYAMENRLYNRHIVSISHDSVETSFRNFAA